MISRPEFFKQFLHGTTGRIELRRMKWNPRKNENGGYEMLERLFSRDVAELEAFAQNGGGDVFHGVNLRDESGRARKENISEIVGAAVDIDFKVTNKEQADEVLAASIFEPTFLINSGKGYHGYFLLDVPLPATKENVGLVEGINKGLARHFGGDYVHDATRILRTPGRKNSKYTDGSMCEIIRSDGPRYSIEDLECFRAPTGGAAAKKVDIGKGNGDLPERFNELLAKHKIIRKTWNGERPDLKDQSRSGYDMAMADLLAVFEFSPEEVAAILRQMPSGKGADASRAYLEYTIGKAFAARASAGEQLTPNYADSKDEGVSVNQDVEEADDLFEPKKVTFPETAWQGPFTVWRDIVFPSTEAPAEYLYVSCLVTIGLALGRNVRIENPRPLYPNIYALLLGQTGDDRKSTALSYSEDALFYIGLADQVDVLRGIQSSEAIYESLAKRNGARVLAYCDEFRSLLAIAQRKGQRDIIPRLGSLYYCPRRDSLDRSDDSTVVTNPFLSLIAATPAEYVQDLLGKLEVDGGFLNRFLTITGAVREWKAIAPRPTGWERFTNAIQKIAAHYDDAECRLDWDPQAAELWTDFYIRWKTGRQSWNEKDRKLTARIDEHILKLAMIYSAIVKQPMITCDALITAIDIGRWLQGVALDAFSDVGSDSFSRAEKAVLGMVRNRGRMYRRHLQQRVYKSGINGEMLTRVVTALVKNGHLVEGVEMSTSGQKKPWVEYIRPRPATG